MKGDQHKILPELPAVECMLIPHAVNIIDSRRGGKGLLNSTHVYTLKLLAVDGRNIQKCFCLPRGVSAIVTNAALNQLPLNTGSIPTLNVELIVFPRQDIDW